MRGVRCEAEKLLRRGGWGVRVQKKGALVGAGPCACPLSLPQCGWYTNRAGTGTCPYEHFSIPLLYPYTEVEERTGPCYSRISFACAVHHSVTTTRSI